MLERKHLSTLILITSLTLVGICQAEAKEPKPGRVGTVISTENGGSYTYVQLDLDGDKAWYAVPAIELTPGDKVVAPAGMLMKAFYSKTLDRTFESVYFAEAIKPAGTPKKEDLLPVGHPPIHKTASQSSTEFDYSGISRAADGKTVEEIYQQQETLVGETITVRGIAVKVANGIMGKNWVHLRDGSGEPGTDDLTVTTTNTVEVGDTITANGTLTTDRDFGFGYKYAVLLEDAAVESE